LLNCINLLTYLFAHLTNLRQIERLHSKLYNLNLPKIDGLAQRIHKMCTVGLEFVVSERFVV